jgi:hypothetical protein
MEQERAKCVAQMNCIVLRSMHLYQEIYVQVVEMNYIPNASILSSSCVRLIIKDQCFFLVVQTHYEIYP